MPRHTVSLPKGTVDRVERLREDGESFSAAVARLIEDGAEAAEGLKVPGYVGIGHSGSRDLSLRDEEVLAEIFSELDPDD